MILLNVQTPQVDLLLTVWPGISNSTEHGALSAITTLLWATFVPSVCGWFVNLCRQRSGSFRPKY